MLNILWIHYFFTSYITSPEQHTVSQLKRPRIQSEIFRISSHTFYEKAPLRSESLAVQSSQESKDCFAGGDNVIILLQFSLNICIKTVLIL
jgi:hypothetical protein